MAISWPTDLRKLMKRISLPAEETFEGLDLLGDYVKEVGDTRETALKAYLRLLGQSGEVFVVNGGLDTNLGTMASPLLSIKKALSLCEANRNDHILVGSNYWQPATEDWPIVVNKNQVHIIGLALPNLPCPAVHPADDNAAFVMGSTGQYGSIQRLTIGGGESYGGILLAGSVALPPEAGQIDGLLIKECTFGHQWFGTPLNGIQQPADSSRGGYGIRVEKCTFLGDLANCTGAITGNAIDLLGNPVNPGVAYYDFEIVNCEFMGCQVGFNAYRAHNGRILNNKFICEDSSDGDAIRLLSACRGNMVDGNVAMAGGEAVPSKQPYCDVAATDKNHWGVNWTGNAVDLPKQSL